MAQNVIELNGKRYDAITGAYLGKSSVIPKHITQQYIHGKVIDGFVRPSHPSSRSNLQPGVRKTPAATHHAEPKPAEHKPAAQDVITKKHTNASVGHVKPHQPEKAKTLMRRATKKPEFSLKPAIKTQAPAEMMAKPQSALMRKQSVYGIDSSRQERAALTNKHQAIQHFHPAHRPAAIPITPRLSVIPVRAAPLRAALPPAGHAKKHTDIFEAAIAHATSHQQPMHKPKRRGNRRLINSLAIVAAFLVIGGFVSYLNLPKLELRVASVQAGFGASMPSYTPTGYALKDGIKRSGGTVSLSFRSGDSSYTVTQQSSNWNSQTLLDNTLALNGDHQTVQKNGQTIYVYGDSTNAAWVNGGVRYDITGNAQLSTDDIISIATSL